MDMTVSPDLEAFYCYGIVFLLGLITARGQISRRLGALPGQWIMVNTWLLFFAYTFLPVGLFWLLDRTNALHDTSFFGAVLVGAGYQQILAGGITSIPAPGGASKFWQPFGAWADGIASRISNRIITNDAHFDEKLLSSLEGDAKKLESLENIAKAKSPDLAALNQSLQEIENNKTILGETAARTKKTAVLYMNLKRSKPQDFQYLLYKGGVIPQGWYLWYAEEWRSKTTAIVVALSLAIVVVMGIVGLATPDNIARYYVWRLHKDNNTDYDRFRAKDKLIGHLGTTQTPYAQLATLLRVPNLPVKTAEDILGLLLQSRQLASAKGFDLQDLLVEALRTDNSDIRVRIQKALLYLAKDKGKNIPEDLQNWQPDSKNTSADIEQIINKWKQVK